MKRYITLTYFKNDFGYSNIQDQNNLIEDKEIQFYIDRASAYIDRNILAAKIEDRLDSGVYTLTQDKLTLTDPSNPEAKKMNNEIAAIEEAIATLAKFGLDTGYDFITGSMSRSLGEENYAETIDFENSFNKIVDTIKSSLAVYETNISVISGSQKVAFEEEDWNGGTIDGSNRPMTLNSYITHHMNDHIAGQGITIAKNNDGSVVISATAKDTSVKYYSGSFVVDWKNSIDAALSGATPSAGDQIRITKDGKDFYGFFIDSTKNVEGMLIEGSKPIGMFVLNYAGNTTTITKFDKIPEYDESEWNNLPADDKGAGTIAFIQGSTADANRLILITTNGMVKLTLEQDLITLETKLTNLINDKANKNDVYTKTEIDNKLNDKADKTEVAKNTNDITSLNTRTTTNTNDISQLKTDGVGDYLGTYLGDNRDDKAKLPATAIDKQRAILEYLKGNDKWYQEYKWVAGTDPSASGWVKIGDERDSHMHSQSPGITLSDVATQQDPKINKKADKSYAFDGASGDLKYTLNKQTNTGNAKLKEIDYAVLLNTSTSQSYISVAENYFETPEAGGGNGTLGSGRIIAFGSSGILELISHDYDKKTIIKTTIENTNNNKSKLVIERTLTNGTKETKEIDLWELAKYLEGKLPSGNGGIV